MRVLIVTGASGGHIFPALSFQDALKKKHNEIDTLLVLPKRNIKKQALNISYKVKYLSISPIELHFDFKNFVAIFNFFKGFFESLFIIFEFSPDIVVGFGSLTCVPLLIIAWVMRIKTLIHEQNVIPGRANRLLARFADKIAISFAQTQDYLGINKTKIVLTGNPIRQELKMIDRFKALTFFGFDDNKPRPSSNIILDLNEGRGKFTILVMGGSHGSHKINMCFQEAISTLYDVYRLQIIHITGEEDYSFLEKSYKDLNLKVKLFSFLKDMQYAYSICDLAISRAGATTIAELINFALPAIIIPYPFAYKHQLSNAKVLERRGCAIIIDDNELNAGFLKQFIESLTSNPDRLKNMRLGYEGFPKVCANESLVNEVMSLQFS